MCKWTCTCMVMCMWTCRCRGESALQCSAVLCDAVRYGAVGARYDTADRRGTAAALSGSRAPPWECRPAGASAAPGGCSRTATAVHFVSPSNKGLSRHKGKWRRNVRFSHRIGEDFEASGSSRLRWTKRPFPDSSRDSSHGSRHLEGTDISLRIRPLPAVQDATLQRQCSDGAAAMPESDRH
jgi:hypothetical protein